MAKLTDTSYKVHALGVGDSGTGKTGSLVSLVAAGYTIRLLDMENGYGILKPQIREQCPDMMDNVELEQVSLEFTIGPMGPKCKNAGVCLSRIGTILDKWQKECSPDDIIVSDSITALGRICFEVSKSQNPGVANKVFHYGNAQALVEPLIAILTGPTFPCHTILFTHIDYRDMNKGKRDPKGKGEFIPELIKGFPSSIGEALNAKIPTYFNEVFRYETIGVGKGAKRVISSIPDGILDVKNTAPSRIKGTYNLDTGLADIFNILTSN